MIELWVANGRFEDRGGPVGDHREGVRTAHRGAGSDHAIGGGLDRVEVVDGP